MAAATAARAIEIWRDPKSIASGDVGAEAGAAAVVEGAHCICLVGRLEGDVGASLAEVLVVGSALLAIALCSGESGLPVVVAGIACAVVAGREEVFSVAVV
jgi:hypothetical protein